MRRSGPAIAALSALAVAQPVLDLFGRNPEFFVAQDLTTAEVVGFALAIALGLPLLLIGVVAGSAALAERAGHVTHRAIVGLLGGAFALALIGRDQQSWLIAAVLAVAAGFVVVGVEHRYEAARTVLRYLSPLPVLVLAMFLVASDTSRLLWSPQAAAAPAQEVGSPASVSVLVFDELPLASLLTEDGDINAARFPNLARLAEAGTWYRNATSPLPRTEAAVPAILSGTIAPGGIPSTIDYPRNLFALLGDSHTINAEEEVTALCPAYACAAEEPTGAAGDRLSGALLDAAVVYGHRTLPTAIREGLPAVNQSWGDFGEQGDGAASDPFGARRDDPASTQTQVGKLAYFDRMIERIDTTGPSLNVAHGVFPHAPWTLTPSGDAYGAITEGLQFEPRLVWSDDPELVQQGQIQHLLQLGAADAAVGRLIDRLQQTGQWESSLVAVVADHGAAFEPGGDNREPTPENLDEIFRIPLIVKQPGQRTGGIDDDPARTVDLVPTIVDALDVETDWTFDGRSLLSGDRSDRRPTAVLRDGREVDLDPTIAPLLALARRNAERFPHGDDWLGVVAVGEEGRHVGHASAALATGTAEDWSWSTDRAAAFDDVEPGFVPIQFSGTLEAPTADARPSSVLVAVNGTVAGVGTQVHETGPRTWSFSTILAEELLDRGPNEVELLVAGSDGAYRSLGTTRGDRRLTAVSGTGGRPETIRIGNDEIDVVPADHRRLEIDQAFTDGRTVVVDGWAADADRERRPDDVALVVDGRQVSTGVDPYPALAEPTGPLAEWGFRLSVPDSTVAGSSTGWVIAVFDDTAVAMSVDWSD